MYQAGSEIKELIEKYKQTLGLMGIHAERVILYGSYARGTQRRGSDIDIAVISSDFRKLNLRERLEILGIAAARIMKPIEAQGYTPEEVVKPQEASFLKEILEAGVTI